jgi:hypothetical protein
MISRRCIPQPCPLACAKGKINGRVAARDHIHDGACDLVQRYVIYTELPCEVGNIAYVFLVGFWCKKGFKLPFSIMHLTDVAQLLEGCNTPAHNWSLTWSIVDFLHADLARIASVNDTLIIFDGEELPFIIKNGPVFLDEAIDLVLYACVEV